MACRVSRITPAVFAAVAALCVPFAYGQTYTEVTPGAAGATASTNDGNVPGNAVDNDLTTRWSANGDGHWPVSYTHLTLPTILRV